jgi:cytochrome d ubiquinol oxidase subunit II
LLDRQGNIEGTLLDLLNPFALLVGLTTVCMLATHGAMYLSMKTDGDMLARDKRWIPRLMAAFFVLNTILVIWTVAAHDLIADRYLQQPWLAIFPAAALLAVIVAWFMVKRSHYFAAFLLSASMIAGLLFSAAIGLYPNLLVSTIDRAYNLTIFNAASQPNTLTVMLIIAVIGIPFVLMYTAGVYYIFRGKVRLSSQSY